MDNTARPKGNPLLVVAVAIALAWLVDLPLWFSPDGIDSPLTQILGGVMMFAPSAAVVVAWLVARRHGVTIRDLARSTGLGLGPRRRRTLLLGGAVWVGVPLFVAVSVLVSGAVGLMRLDIGGLGLFRQLAHHMAGGGDLPVGVYAVVSLAMVPLAPVLNAITCFGEEWGWRGWLMPRLLGYGRLRAIVASGVVWGIWHAPLTLLGYNYPALGAWAAALFVPFCVLYGAFLSWTRLATGSIWPAVIGHGALNGSAVLLVLAAAAGPQPNTALAGPVGVVGMALLAVLLLVLYGPMRRALPSSSEARQDAAAGAVPLRDEMLAGDH